VSVVRSAVLLALGSTLLSGCAPQVSFPPPISSVTPSKTGVPNSIVSFGNFEFVSVQGTGQIFTYNTSSGLQVLAGTPYTTPCHDPSGMVIATIAGKNVMAAACYDTGSLLTLAVNADGSLSPLGSVTGLPMPFPGIALDGTDVLVPLFGGTTANGAVAKVSIATPASPAIEGMVTLASPVAGGVANAEYLAIAGGYIYVTSGSESNPLGSSSTVQVVNEATMALVGSPLVVPHSPQQIAVQGTVAYVTLYDAAALESIDISNPAALKPLQIVGLSAAGQNCDALPVAVQNNLAYVGCYGENVINSLDVSNPSQMRTVTSVSGISSPQRMEIDGDSLRVTGASTGGQVYQIDMAQF
jgi:LVIVD repeat